MLCGISYKKVGWWGFRKGTDPPGNNIRGHVMRIDSEGSGRGKKNTRFSGTGKGRNRVGVVQNLRDGK